MLGNRATSSWLRNGRPTPWNRPSRSNSLVAPISSRTSSVGKSSIRMITPSHSPRKFSGRRSKTSCAMASISASDGALAEVHMVFVYSILVRKPAPQLIRDTGFGLRVQLTLARQSETVGSTTGLGGRDDADQDGGSLAGLYRGIFAARSRSESANRAIRGTDGAGVATRRHGGR